MVSRKWFRSRAPWIAAAILIVLSFAGYATWRRGTAEPQEVVFSDLLGDIDRGVVTEVVVTEESVAEGVAPTVVRKGGAATA